MYATKDLKQDHVSVRRLKNIIERCSDKLYTDEDIPIEHIEIISVVIEEFVDRFHHGKEEQLTSPKRKTKMGLQKIFANF